MWRAARRARPLRIPDEPARTSICRAGRKVLEEDRDARRLAPLRFEQRQPESSPRERDGSPESSCENYINSLPADERPEYETARYIYEYGFYRQLEQLPCITSSGRRWSQSRRRCGFAPWRTLRQSRTRSRPRCRSRRPRRREPRSAQAKYERGKRDRLQGLHAARVVHAFARQGADAIGARRPHVARLPSTRSPS